MKKILALIGFVMMCLTVNAQQDLLLSQQFFSRINKNPAGTGNVTDLDLFLLGRYQYIEIKDAPKSGVLNAQTFVDKWSSGIGLSVSFDKVGPGRSTTNAKFAYAYTANLTNDLILSLGLSGGIQSGYFDPSKYTPEDPTEFLDMQAENKITPDFDFGFELTTPRFLFGASATHITQNQSTTFISGRHFYSYIRYMFPVSQSLEVAPALVWMHKSAPKLDDVTAQRLKISKSGGFKGVDVVELQVMAFYERFLWGGLTYSPDIHDKFNTNPVAATVGIEYRDFRIGYTFGWAFGDASRLSGNAQELMLSYSISGRNKAQQPVFE
jgi:type IX secretion system PorP/SprF family membrane protein